MASIPFHKFPHEPAGGGDGLIARRRMAWLQNVVMHLFPDFEDIALPSTEWDKMIMFLRPASTIGTADTYKLVFETEEDLVLFLLRWS